MTPWASYRTLDGARLLSVMRGKLLFDTAGLWNAEKMVSVGFTYDGHRPGPPGARPDRPRPLMRVAIIGAGLQTRRRAPVIAGSKTDTLVVVATSAVQQAEGSARATAARPGMTGAPP